MKNFIIGFLLTIIIGFIVIQNLNENNVSNIKEIVKQKSIHESYEYVELELRIDGNADLIVNVTDNYEYLEFEVTFYDENNNITDTVNVRKDNLKANNSYTYFFDAKFNLLDIASGKVVNCEVTDVKGSY